ncbi:DUF6479 family protein [Streptomyces sp. NPDC051963]|uniref:DUF6479 family protein n=1 Tax=Streptomyces sp. NPDC051963 TaxID=3365678 RepID=UPI0037CE6070
MNVIAYAVANAIPQAVRLGIKVRGREPGPPSRRDQPTLPETGPVRRTRGSGSPRTNSRRPAVAARGGRNPP